MGAVGLGQEPYRRALRVRQDGRHRLGAGLVRGAQDLRRQLPPPLLVTIAPPAIPAGRLLSEGFMRPSLSRRLAGLLLASVFAGAAPGVAAEKGHAAAVDIPDPYLKAWYGLTYDKR